MASMFKLARLNKIKQIISERKQIDVGELSNLLGVSEVTIRSYLELLEEEGYIIRTHGGAILNEAEPSLLTFSSLTGSDEEEKDKKMISRIAQCFIKEGDVIFLGSGNICARIAQDIREGVNITVITNSLVVAALLSGKPSVTLILAGGRVDNKTNSTVGNMVISNLDQLFINKAFIEVNGVDLKHGYSVDNIDSKEIYSALLSSSDEFFVVAPESCFNKTSLVKFAPLSAAKKVITTAGIPNEYKSYFFDNNVQIFTSYDLGEDFGG